MYKFQISNLKLSVNKYLLKVHSTLHIELFRTVPVHSTRLACSYRTHAIFLSIILFLRVSQYKGLMFGDLALLKNLTKI